LDILKLKSQLIYLINFFNSNFRSKGEDQNKKQAERDMKKHIREYLDMQVEEKKRIHNFEINLDHEQARVWKIDCENFHRQEKDINQKVKIKI